MRLMTLDRGATVAADLDTAYPLEPLSRGHCGMALGVVRLSAPHANEVKADSTALRLKKSQVRTLTVEEHFNTLIKEIITLIAVQWRHSVTLGAKC